jgi:hypothetical protein
MGQPDHTRDLGVDVAEAFLAHYGKKGMRWGVRSAATSLASKSTERRIQQHKNARDNKGLTGKLALADKYTWGGNGRHERYQNKSIAQLERSKERISNGELVAKTLLFGPQYTKAPKKKKG